MTEKEYNAYYQRVLDDTMRTYYDPMMNMAHVVTIDEPSRKIIPMISKDCELLTPFEKQQCCIVQKCTLDEHSIDYAEALLLLGDSYKENIKSYMDYGRFVSPGLYPVRYYELQALAWTGELESDIVCICRDDKNISEYNYIHVCKSGYVKRTDMDGNKLFDPDSFYICFLIDLEFADFIRRKMKKEELKNITNDLKTLSTDTDSRPIITSQHLFKTKELGIAIKDRDSFKISVYIVPATLYTLALENPDFTIHCNSSDIQDKIYDNLQEEFIKCEFGELSLESIRKMLLSKDYPENSWYFEPCTCSTDQFQRLFSKTPIKFDEYPVEEKKRIGLASKMLGCPCITVRIFTHRSTSDDEKFLVKCKSYELRDRVLKDINYEFMHKDFGELSMDSISTMIKQKGYSNEDVTIRSINDDSLVKKKSFAQASLIDNTFYIKILISESDKTKTFDNCCNHDFDICYCYIIHCFTKSLQERMYEDIEHELQYRDFGEPSIESINEMLKALGYNSKGYFIEEIGKEFVMKKTLR